MAKKMGYVKNMNYESDYQVSPAEREEYDFKDCINAVYAIEPTKKLMQPKSMAAEQDSRQGEYRKM